MKNLKFKAFRKSNGKLYEVYTLGGLDVTGMDDTIFATVWDDENEDVINLEMPDLEEVIQWTGRTDADGEGIYETDFVMYKGDKAEIQFNEGRWEMRQVNSLEGVLGHTIPLNVADGRTLKVVGNRLVEEEETYRAENE